MAPKTTKQAGLPKPQTIGESILDGLRQALAWIRGENDDVRVTRFQVPKADVREVRTQRRSPTSP
jgi:hypothetical protein